MSYKTGKDLVDDAKGRISEVTAKEARGIHGTGDDTVFLDVREPNEWNVGRIARAVHIPRGNLETKIENLISRDKKVVVYCANGNRSALAADTLGQMGYPNVTSISDGWTGWVAVEGEVEG